MNMDAIVMKGMLPWLPHQSAVDLQVAWMYQVPLTGSFRLNDRIVAFTALGDTLSRTTVWAYVELTDRAAEELRTRQFDDVDELDGFTESMFAGRRAAFALAHDNHIERWSALDVGESGVLGAATDFLDEVLKQMDTDDRPASERARRAQVDATMRELDLV